MDDVDPLKITRNDLPDRYDRNHSSTMPRKPNCRSSRRSNSSWSTQNNDHYAVQSHSRWPILVPVNCGKPTCEFLLVINANLHPIPQHFHVIENYWSYLHLQQGAALFNTLIWSEPLNSRPRNLPQETINIALSWGAKVFSFDILNSLDGSRIWRSDRQNHR